MKSWIRSALAPAVLPVALSAAMLVTACGPGSGAAKDSTAVTSARTEAESTDGYHGAAADDGEDGTDGTDGTAESHEDLEESEAGKEDGIIIGLPQNENGCMDPVYSTEEGTVEQVMFHDGITDSDAILRASREEDGDPSVFYYMLDDSRKVTWTAKSEDGTEIIITVEVTIENSDIPGVLATWGYNGTLFALWEDDAVSAVDSVAKLAVEIAGRSR